MSSEDGSPRPQVFVGPSQPADVTAAVTAGGCVVTSDPRRAEAVVWVGGDGAELAGVLHDGVRWLQLPDAGVERWLTSGVLSARRTVTSATGVYGEQVAEHALALTLACLRRLPQCARATSWQPEDLRGTVLAGAEVVVVGAGGIGIAFLRLLAPFGCRTVAVTRTGAPVADFDITLPIGRLEEALPTADVVVLAVPLTAETTALVNAERLRLMKPSAVIINVGRGGLVDTAALVAALEGGALGAAGLDVTDPEPLPDGHPLWRLPQVLITPHTANPPAARSAGLARRVEENCRRYAAGEGLAGVIRAELGY
ncbi:MAG: D-isomer specific 2-hydroxyacid dehydrogenase NAD-binding protein [Frankiales bacterium]|nr:D-isomer specific 2-hydroxyacid dehydrogenase NAD-binding protein [Frankiales bacterium]